jgi:serine/threonine protein kinase
MKLQSRRLGPYEILSSLGSGGMGEVYRARDTRLGREVAIKVLPAELASHPERLRRFEREARAASALNHPNIVMLHDVGREEGIDFLVMELIEGETLAERLSRGPLPLEQVLALGEQICSALEACHQKGMVHRDLKPGNVMLTRSGVKVLDFGLARAFEAEPTSEPAKSSAPTAAAPLTREGVAVGTLPYMAPEQLQGGSVDARCDLFAFGAVLYEAVTGRRAFAGDTDTAVARAILTSDPPPASTLAPGCPRSLDRLIRFCLEKDRERRFRSAHDAALQLSAIAEGEVSRPETPTRPSRRINYWMAGALALACVALVAVALRDITSTRPAALERTVRFQFAPPPGGAFLSHVEGPLMAISPDGSRVAFIASEPDSPPQVWVRHVDEIEPSAISGTETASSLFWSPDGGSIAFFTRAGSLRRVDLSGGAPVTIVDLPAGIGRVGTWGAAEILFSSIQGEAMYRVSPDGGEAEVIKKPDTSRGESRIVWPWFLPDGKSFLYWVKTKDGEGRLMLARPGEAPKDIAAIDSQSQYVEPGLLVYAKEGVLLAQRFDAGKGNLEGAPFPLAPQVLYFLSTGWAAFATSPTGTLAYRSERNVMRLSWFDRSGKRLGNVGSPGEYLTLAISADGRRVLFDKVRADLGTLDIWSLDLERGIETRLTSHPDTEFAPRWLPGGKRIVYSAVRGGRPQLVRRDLGAENEETLVPSPGLQEAVDVSPDGRALLFIQRNAASGNLWTLPLEGDEKPTAVAFLPSDFEQYDGRFSRDGRWVTFLSNESGRYEAYVTAREGSGEKLQVSREGATKVRWGWGGSELVYLSMDGRLFSVPFTAGPEIGLGNAKLLFQLPKESIWRTFEMAPDGERFLAIVIESSGDERPGTVVLNWPALLER